MKTKPAKRSTSFLLSYFFVLIVGCRPSSEKLYDQAHIESEKGHFRIAVSLLERGAKIEKENPARYRFLLEAARLARFEMQDYEKAIRIYKEVVLNSTDEPQRISSQKALAEVYFDNLQNYTQALKEMLVLEPRLKNQEDREALKLKIIRCLYLTGQNQQALEEINTSLSKVKYELLNFLKLKAQVLVAMKKYQEAIDTYQKIYDKDQRFFENENLFIAASVVYEENEQFESALKYLNKYEKQIKDKAYLELRYKRLKERMMNKPLFKGKRK